MITTPAPGKTNMPHFKLTYHKTKNKSPLQTTLNRHSKKENKNNSPNKKTRLLQRVFHSKVCLISILKQVKPSTISTAQLNTLLYLHLPPIKLVVYQRSYPLPLRGRMGDLILGRASHLDAFSAYPCQT